MISEFHYTTFHSPIVRVVLSILSTYTQSSVCICSKFCNLIGYRMQSSNIVEKRFNG